jgi:signal transduction histidine kinase
MEPRLSDRRSQARVAWHLPPLPVEKGLPTALQAQAGKATLPITVEADGIGRYPQDPEAALYFCILEDLQNIQKYAQASRAVVRLRQDGDQLAVEVADDERGFVVSTSARGKGLTNMEDPRWPWGEPSGRIHPGPGRHSAPQFLCPIECSPRAESARSSALC